MSVTKKLLSEVVKPACVAFLETDEAGLANKIHRSDAGASGVVTVTAKRTHLYLYIQAYAIVRPTSFSRPEESFSERQKARARRVVAGLKEMGGGWARSPVGE
ncbi:hypothetical protein QN386_13435 [Pseudomonas sp. CCI3.2]|uniref:hypothetical protein n=1 Tax=Pseudomonas sp. CCI3.2 TaxID=3048619 RepID=UPI002B23BE53|nr:hypothetical protein [Pseudomonas sp. CCI3.2]MEB0102319.1 hypothetical protein [Pseudomonas sp. CCI3.2]MEB0129651.1 hypothetical protein [Pseudomonas sp. CCI2.4]MEB0165860.1 hypothetical protein [Pseudomonas sp. CCC4.4]